MLYLASIVTPLRGGRGAPVWSDQGGVSSRARIAIALSSPCEHSRQSKRPRWQPIRVHDNGVLVLVPLGPVDVWR
jgi:hypothetical protein